jgi:hypothetical protein
MRCRNLCFANTITTTDSENVQTDVYVYNGAGVAIGVGFGDQLAIRHQHHVACPPPAQTVHCCGATELAKCAAQIGAGRLQF